MSAPRIAALLASALLVGCVGVPTACPDPVFTGLWLGDTSTAKERGPTSYLVQVYLADEDTITAACADPVKAAAAIRRGGLYSGSPGCFKPATDQAPMTVYAVMPESFADVQHLFMLAHEVAHGYMVHIK